MTSTTSSDSTAKPHNWIYCPECGSAEIQPENQESDTNIGCTACGQHSYLKDWYSRPLSHAGTRIMKTVYCPKCNLPEILKEGTTHINCSTCDYKGSVSDWNTGWKTICTYCSYTNTYDGEQPKGDTPLKCKSCGKVFSYKRASVLSSGGTQFSTGAVRSSDANHVMYQLISPIGLRRVAETMKEGFDKYGAYNWEAGMPIGDLLNHAIKHIYDYLQSPSPSSRKEDDLAHAAWNLMAAMHMEETHPELDHGLRNTK